MIINQNLLLGFVFILQGAAGTPQEFGTLDIIDYPLLTEEHSLLIKPSSQERTGKQKDSLGAAYIFPHESLSSSQVASPYSQWWTLRRDTLIAILLLLTVYHIKRNRRQRQMLWLKKRISADLHDEFGSRLTNIQFLSAISDNADGTNPELRKQLRKIGVEVSSLTESLNDIVWILNKGDENLEEVVAKMRSYIGESRIYFGFDCQLDISLDFQGKKLNMTKRRVLLMVFKEMLNNIRKHARATEVHISISEKNSSFCLVIEDNGAGFDPFKRTERHGIRNAIERIAKVKGEFNITSNFNKGSRIEVLLPFSKSIIQSILESGPTIRKPKFIRIPINDSKNQ